MEVLQNILIAAFAAIPPSLLAWAALRQARRATEKVIEGNDKTDTVVQKADGLIAIVDVVHDLSNSNFSQLLADQRLAIKEASEANKRATAADERVAKFETLATKLLEKLNGNQSDRDDLAKAKKR